MKKRDFNILKETISPQNVQVMSELITIQEIKFLIGYIGAPMITMRNNLLKDFYYKSEPNYQISDSYDLVQECTLFLCKHFGKKLSDVHHIDKKGRKITIEMQAIRCMNKLINRQSRSAKTEISLDVLIERNTPIVEIPVENNNDYSNVDRIIKNLNLNETQALALECRMNGMSYPEIASVINRAISTSYDMLKFIQKRYRSIYE
ncbi:MAG: sigma-70 family RNA polymerase sigma factor [Clostridiales bacterium]|nr:sigma-70 family RNA polymerase sigma factor [Clostridiales bacterium]